MPALLSLGEWESFYVITGSSGAALTGLMFVVVALAAERSAQNDTMTAFATPNIIHFSIVLLIASMVTMPRRTWLSLSLCLLACALGGLIYNVRGLVRMRRQKEYQPVMEDWIWHGIFPVVAYIGLAVSSLLLLADEELALYLVAGVVLFLLSIGIHNAWDAAVYVAVNKGKAP